MKKILATTLLAGTLLFSSGCLSEAQREALLRETEKMELVLDNAKQVQTDIEFELLTNPDLSDEAVSALLEKMSQADEVIKESREFIVQAREVLANANDGEDATLGLAETLASLFGLTTVAGGIAVARSLRRKYKNINILTEGLTTADENTLANLDPEFARALRTPPRSGS